MRFLYSTVQFSLFLLAFTAFSLGCNNAKPPKASFSAFPTPAPPDYSQLSNWAAHPDTKDQADTVPKPKYKDRQADAPADVFFIHPTTSFDTESWNGDLQDEKLNEKTDELAIRHQASAFNGVGRIFAPRYRQMVYGGFFEKEDLMSVKKASQVAYQDVEKAFSYYLENENKGRPFIIASHSQGTAHAIRLIKNKVENTPVLDQLIAAYLVGWPMSRDTFSILQPCENAGETGCFVTWCTFAWGHGPKEMGWYQTTFSTNPITWKTDTVESGMEDHTGLLMGNYKKMYDGVVKAKVHGSYLWASRPKVPGAWLIRTHNLHIADYNLFWGNIRANAELRVNRYFEKRGE